MVRPAASRPSLTMPNNYEVLLLKRQKDLAFGGYYAFPGGKVEVQDHFETYQSVLPHFSETIGKHFHDFNKRSAAIRELFEECNFMLSTNQ